MGSERVCGGRVCWGGECARRGGLAVREGPLASGGEYNQALRPPTPMGCCRAGMEDEGLPGQQARARYSPAWAPFEPPPVPAKPRDPTLGYFGGCRPRFGCVRGSPRAVEALLPESTEEGSSTAHPQRAPGVVSPRTPGAG
eukprot:scaffold16087_cov112-Isochrysis_galbana.AAC.8